jgi:amidase
MTEIWKMSVAELASRLRKRELSSREVIEAYLQRIQAVNPSLNAVTAVLADEALLAADAADRALDEGREAGPLCGVPMTVKEGVDVQGSTTTHGGSYDSLYRAHAAVQQWIEAEGLTAAGAPWECYVTDPADYPDPKDWKTEIFWPLT